MLRAAQRAARPAFLSVTPRTTRRAPATRHRGTAASGGYRLVGRGLQTPKTGPRARVLRVSKDGCTAHSTCSDQEFGSMRTEAAKPRTRVRFPASPPYNPCHLHTGGENGRGVAVPHTRRPPARCWAATCSRTFATALRSPKATSSVRHRTQRISSPTAASPPLYAGDRRPARRARAAHARSHARLVVRGRLRQCAVRPRRRLPRSARRRCLKQLGATQETSIRSCHAEPDRYRRRGDAGLVATRRRAVLKQPRRTAQ